jgi:hypothetical protein
LIHRPPLWPPRALVSKQEAAIAKLYNLARVSTATTGTGTITLGAAVSGYLTFALAGLSGSAEVFISPNSATLQQPDFRNLIVNGAFAVWQRGAGGAASIAQAASLTAYNADRWFLITNATQASVISQQAGLITGSRWSARILRNSGQTGTGVMRFEYPLTVDECITLRGQFLSLQFWASSGANWSPTSGTVNVNAYFGTGTEGKRGAGSYTGETNPLTTSVNVTAGAAAAQTKFTGASTVATNVTQGCLQFSWTPVGTAGAADNLNLDQVQLEAGVVPTDYERLPFRMMLHEMPAALLQVVRLCDGTGPERGEPGRFMETIFATLPTFIAIQWRYPVAMRSAPTITLITLAANALIPIGKIPRHLTFNGRN